MITGICLFRLFHLPFAGWTRHKFEKINNGIFISSVAVTALIWGVGFARFMIQLGEPHAKLVMVMCSIGLCAGGVVAFIPELKLSIAFNFLMLAPVTAAMAFHQMDMPIIIAMILFFMYLSFMAARGNKEYWDALENEFLLKQKSKDLERISRVDSLTGLYNRRYFDELMSFEWNRALRYPSPISIIICDIDHFKGVNDRYGHLAGDEYLKETARLLREVFRRQTDITARYGGEEFVVMMPHESFENAMERAEKVRSRADHLLVEYNGRTIRTTISLGVATCAPQPGDKIESLISKADEALYQSKKSGRNRVTGYA